MFITNDLDIFPFFSISAVLHQLRIPREVMHYATVLLDAIERM